MTLEAVEGSRRERASTVKRLRVAVMSDPARAGELADALVALTRAHLLAWDFAEAATVAPDAVVQSARILAARGPSGPYTSVPDAVRYFSATAQLAAVQAGLGQPDAAGRTLDGLDAWRQQVARLPLAADLPAEVVVWSLVARSRSLLDGDPAAANAAADAAAERLYGMDDPPAYVALAVQLLLADTRWAAGRVESSLAHSRLALDTHSRALADRSAVRRPAIARAALAPVPAVYEAYARRLRSSDPDGGIALRRAEVSLLEFFPAADALEPAVAGLAAALAAAGRTAEADEFAPADRRGDSEDDAPGQRVDWEPLAEVFTLSPLDAGQRTAARSRWQAEERAALLAGVAARAEAERSESAHRAAFAEAAARRAAEREREARAAAAAAAASAALQEAARRREAEDAAARAEREAEAARAEAEERRRALAAEHRTEVDPELAAAAAAELDRARQAVHAASGDAALAVAYHRLADVLRPLAAADDARRAELAVALESLVGLLWRLGDPGGSRAAAREAKALG